MSASQADHGHHHGDHAEYYAQRAEAIESLLVEKGICTLAEIVNMAEALDARSPADGARVVSHAWADPAFKARLLADPIASLDELGYTLPETAPRLTVLENTEKVHFVAVCTLCSCYPRAILGRPPDWYKALAYRSRVVVDPRSVLREFGLDLSDSVEVRVIDSTADMRYLVLPNRPAGTEGMSEEQLAQLVTQESMIGVADALSPASVASSR